MSFYSSLASQFVELMNFAKRINNPKNKTNHLRLGSISFSTRKKQKSHNEYFIMALRLHSLTISTDSGYHIRSSGIT